MDSLPSPLMSARSASGVAIRDVIVKAKEKIRTLQDELASVKGENQNLQLALNQASVTMSEALSKQKKIKSDINKQKTQYSEAMRQKQVLEIDYKDVKHRIKTNMGAGERMASDLQDKIQKLNETLTSTKDSNESELESLRVQLEQEQRRHAEAREILKVKEEEALDLKHQIRHLTDQNTEEAALREDDIKDLKKFLAS